ncbi:MAG TPA: hypothetical protein VFG05_05530 [Methylocella sp.]|nr:hypothetical protein [Methylocella sp.]
MPARSSSEEELRADGAASASDEPALSIFTKTKDSAAQRFLPLTGNAPGLSSYLAVAICLFGFAWAAGSYFTGEKSLFGPGGDANSGIRQEKAGRAELAQSLERLTADIGALQNKLVALERAQRAEKVSEAADALAARLNAARSESAAAIANLAEKIDRARREQDDKLIQLAARLDRMEQKLASATASLTGAGALPAPGAPQKRLQMALAAPKTQAEAGPWPRKPRLITNWVVRDAYDGLALVESPAGAIEVAPGEILPGAGRVKSIERRGAGWIVITSQGLVDSARNGFPQ